MYSGALRREREAPGGILCGMGDVVSHFIEEPRSCDYLPGQRASLEYRVMTKVGPDELETMLVRGWRRLGPFYYRPACGGCLECVPLRIPVASFVPSRSQARARRRASRLRLQVGLPRADRPRLDLYARWHAAREQRRGWPSVPLGADEYALQFAYPHPAGRELTLWDAGRLVAVSLCDVTPRAWSAIYCFYDPDLARLSLGVANVMFCVELARARGLSHVYLGYRVLGCPSMRYKEGFRPHELLVGRPGPDEEPRWISPPGSCFGTSRLVKPL
ncbi:MAG TPA: arginyltransferase [Vicinamibacteria bacterium]|nr:arginyltransferase [Vicinamibacteria bacterium]